MSFESLASKKFCVCEFTKDLVKRIYKLEHGNSILADGLLDTEKQFNKIFPRLHNLECKMSSLLKEAEMMHDKISELESKFADFMSKSTLNSQKRPFKCPVCSGEAKKLVTHGIMEPFEVRITDSRGLHYICCHSCEGKGIVWG